ncbi:Ldh family oxidoreductase [Chthonobacter albigriseus]|uniref:Ldh family oxidoreductase n=1 Tax=Chthonobacter albigriseus TaxID=1683161 RepID=UPI0015EEFA66|nr:Ldh family oxidoreductase [Chthonobacter albigriseus]
MRVCERDAQDLAVGLLRGYGVPEKSAQIQAGILVEAELRGHPSHGLQRLPRLLRRIERGLADPVSQGEFRWRSEGVLEGDGLRGLGPVVAFAALDRLLERVGRTGVALAAVSNAQHLGMLAQYVEAIASTGRIGIAMSSSEALVHPHGGTSRVLGTNPIAIGVPSADGAPFVVDLATSEVSMGKIHHHAAIGRPLQPGWATDADGRPTTDAVRARDGAIAPFGQAKGYALGLAIELIVAAVAGTPFAPSIRGTLDAEAVCNKGDIFLVLDTCGSTDLLRRIADYLDFVRAAPSADPETPVSIPGDGARRRRTQAANAGFEVDPGLWARLNDLSLHKNLSRRETPS